MGKPPKERDNWLLTEKCYIHDEGLRKKNSCKVSEQTQRQAHSLAGGLALLSQRGRGRVPRLAISMPLAGSQDP